MSDVSFLTAVKTSPSFIQRSRSSPVSLPIFPSLSEIEFIGLSLEEPFGVLEDEDELVLLEEFWKGNY